MGDGPIGETMRGDVDDAERGGEADRALIEGVRRGDADAFANVVSRYAPLLVGYGRRMGLHADEARELAIDALADVATELAAARRPRAGVLAARAGALFRERAYAEKAD